MWSCPSHEAVPDHGRGEEQRSEARERCSAHCATEQCSFDSDGYPLVPPHSVELFPSPVCGPDPLVNLCDHREHGWVILFASSEPSIFHCPSKIGQDHQLHRVLLQAARFQRLIKSILCPANSTLAIVCSAHFSFTSSANSVTPQERSLSSCGLHPKMPPFSLKTTPHSSGAFLSPMNSPTCARPLANAIWCQHFRKKPPSPCEEEEFVDVTESRLDRYLRRLPVQRAESVCHVQTLIDK